VKCTFTTTRNTIATTSRPAVWCLLLGLGSVRGAWRRLAGRYADMAPFAGEVTGFASAQFGLVSYSGVLRVGAPGWVSFAR
jgi:hypothetical protein